MRLQPNSGVARRVAGTGSTSTRRTRTQARLRLRAPGKQGSTSSAENEAKRGPYWGDIGTLITGLATAGALIFTALSVQATQDQVAITRDQSVTAQQGQLTDRFTKAVEQIGAGKLEVRVGGIYALERIAQDSPRDHPAVMDVLATFIREHQHSTRDSHASLPADLQAAATVVFRRDTTNDPQGYRLDLVGANLAFLDTRNANLTNADIVAADFSWADLPGADLRNVRANEANFTGAKLNGANFDDATIPVAEFATAELDSSSFRKAVANDTSFRFSFFRNATVAGADFEGVDFTGAKLKGTDLGRTNRDGASGLPTRHAPG